MTNDYTLVSQEAYVLQLLKYVKSSLRFSKGEYDTDKSIFKDYSDRWNKLVQFKCDPWTELKSFNTFLENKPKEYKIKEQKVGFKLVIYHHNNIWYRYLCQRHICFCDTLKKLASLKFT